MKRKIQKRGRIEGNKEKERLPRADGVARGANEGPDIAQDARLEAIVLDALLGAQREQNRSRRLRGEVDDGLAVDLLVLGVAHHSNTKGLLSKKHNDSKKNNEDLYI